MPSTIFAGWLADNLIEKSEISIINSLFIFENFDARKDNVDSSEIYTVTDKT